MKKANESAPDDTNVRFQLRSCDLFLAGELPEAAEQLRIIIAAKPQDGDAYYVLSKALAGHERPCGGSDRQSGPHILDRRQPVREFREGMGKVERRFPDIGLRVEQPQRRDFRKRRTEPKIVDGGCGTDERNREFACSQARTQFKNGSDDDAMVTLRRSPGQRTDEC